MDKLQQFQNRLPEGADCAVILSEVNRRYFTGFPSSDGILFVTRDNAWFLTDFRYIEAARKEARGCDVVLLENRAKQLSGLVKHCRAKTAAIESTELSVSEFNRLKRELPELSFDGSDKLSSLIKNLRMIKTEDELKKIKTAQEITDAAFEHILGMIKPGVTERSLALEIEYFMKKNGAKGPSFDLIVITGEKTSMPHGVPGGAAVAEGDFVTMDIGAVYDGYCSDMTRTVAVGRIGEEQKRVYETVLKAQLSSIKAIRAGANCSDVDKIARDIIDSAGYKGCFGHGLGHSVGLEIHEEPRFSPSCDTVLENNMVMTVEPGVYLEKKFGVRIEDLVVVENGGLKNLTKSPKELIIL